MSDAGIHVLAEVFALYLADYPDVNVTIGGKRIDPAQMIASRKAINLTDIHAGGKTHPVRLEIVEWKGLSNRALFLCNEKRFPLVQVDRRFHIGDFQFTAYLESSYLTVAQKEGIVDLAEMQTPVVAAVLYTSSSLVQRFYLWVVSPAYLTERASRRINLFLLTSSDFTVCLKGTAVPLAGSSSLLHLARRNVTDATIHQISKASQTKDSGSVTLNARHEGLPNDEVLDGLASRSSTCIHVTPTAMGHWARIPISTVSPCISGSISRTKLNSRLLNSADL